MEKDRISELPDELLHHIMSYLPIEKAATLSCLSSRWKNVHFTLRNFSLQLFHGPRNDKLLDFIDKKLVKQVPTHNICIRRFHLEEDHFRSDPVVRQYVERWVELLAQFKIEELVMKFSFDNEYCPQAILTSKSITVLSLTNCTLLQQGLNIDDINLVSLKRLKFKNVFASECLLQKILATNLDLKAVILKFSYHREFCHHAILSLKNITLLSLSGCVLRETSSNIDDVNLVSLKRLTLKYVVINECLIQKILATSLNLEEVRLKFCRGLTCMKITGLNRLKTLKLRTMKSLDWVEIDAPSLVRFSHHVLNPPNTCELRFTNCSNLKELTLISPNETNDSLSKIILVLNNLKHLNNIQSDFSFFGKEKSLVISNTSLTSLLVHDCEQLSKVEINIRSLEYLDLHYDKILSVSRNTPPKMEAKLTFIYLEEMGSKDYISLLNLLRELSGSKKVTLRIGLQEMLIPEAWKTHFACTEFLNRYQHIWLGTNIGLWDMLHMIFPNLYILYNYHF